MSARLRPRSMPQGNDVAICVFQLCFLAEVSAVLLVFLKAASIKEKSST